MPEAIVRGQQGKEVERLQRLLARTGQRITIDGVFGPRTQAAMASFLRTRGRAGTGARVDAEQLELLELAAGHVDRPGKGGTAEASRSTSTSSSFVPMLAADERSRIDCLGVQAEARAFARLICSRRTATPLSVGLLGDWGSGKSFFMSRLQGEIETRCAAFTRVANRLQAQGDLAGLDGLRERWHGRVAQISFNAWHYAEPNLWASLVTRVFDELASIISPAEPIEDTRSRLLAEVADGKQRREQAKLDLRKAETQLAEARVERERREAEVSRMREELAVVEALEPAATAPAAGGGTGEAAPAAPRMTVRGPIAALRVTLRWVWSRGRWSRVAVVAGALLFVLGIVLLLAWWRGWWQSWLDPTIAAATSAAGVCAGVAGTASAWWTIVQPRIDQTRSIYAVYVEQRSHEGGLVDRAVRGLLGPSEGALAVARQRMEEAAVGLDSAKMATEQAGEKVARARRMLQELEGNQRFYAFVKDRDEGDDYRRHLGLVSLVRDDFARLEQILDQVEREGPGDGEVAPLSRIVLYVDDLDRCEPARVVEVLQALQLLLSTPIFVVVVAADVRWLRRSLALHFDRLLQRDGHAAAKADEDGTGPTPRGFLEQIFQVPFSLRPIDADGFAALVRQAIARPGVSTAEARAEAERLAELRRVAADESVAEPAAKQEASAKQEPAAKQEASVKQEPAAKQEPVAKQEPAATQEPAAKPEPAAKQEPSSVRLVDVAMPRTQEELDADLMEDAALALDAAEVAFLQRLHAVVGTPRLTKTLVSTYRLLRAEIEAGVLPAYVADGTCRGVITLLAIQVGHPDDAMRLFDALHRTRCATLGEVLHELAAEAGSDRREARWQALAAAVQAAGTADARVSVLTPWTAQIRRFSFDPWPTA